MEKDFEERIFYDYLSCSGQCETLIFQKKLSEHSIEVTSKKIEEIQQAQQELQKEIIKRKSKMFSFLYSTDFLYDRLQLLDSQLKMFTNKLKSEKSLLSTAESAIHFYTTRMITDKDILKNNEFYYNQILDIEKRETELKAKL